ncbi:MAG TPA: hypothetical protein ENI23_01570 [bacterium]|nr:hypothetical protein [bacterium]
MTTIKITQGISEPHENRDPVITNIENNTTVAWENEDSLQHTVSSGTPRNGCDGKFNSKIISTNEAFNHVFTETGEYPFFCMVHPWETGKIIVS